MTFFAKSALWATLAATLSLAIAPTTVVAKSHKATAMHPGALPHGLTNGTQGQSPGQNNTFCGNGDVFVIYDEDANGNKVPDTERYGCTD
jgi:hypothetical protein